MPASPVTKTSPAAAAAAPALARRGPVGGDEPGERLGSPDELGHRALSRLTAPRGRCQTDSGGHGVSGAYQVSAPTRTRRNHDRPPSTPRRTSARREPSGRTPPRPGTAGARPSRTGSAEATKVMLDRAGVVGGARVLDVAAGAGGQTLARRPTGRSDAATCSRPTSRPRSSSTPPRGRGRRLRNVSTREVDGERLDVEGGGVRRGDLAGGPDLLPRPAGRARAGCTPRCARAAGCPSVVYSTADRNGFFSVPVGIIRRRAQLPPPAARASRDRSASAAPGSPRRPQARRLPRHHRRRRAVAGADGERRRVRALRAGVLRRAAPDAGRARPSQREEAWAEIGEALEQFEGPDGFVGPCEMLVVTGTQLQPAGGDG